jgi:hypothetical protein
MRAEAFVPNDHSTPLAPDSCTRDLWPARPFAIADTTK